MRVTSWVVSVAAAASVASEAIQTSTVQLLVDVAASPSTSRALPSAATRTTEDQPASASVSPWAMSTPASNATTDSVPPMFCAVTCTGAYEAEARGGLSH